MRVPSPRLRLWLSSTQSAESSGGSSAQTAAEAMRAVCIDGPQAVAGIQDLAQKDYEYGRYIGIHVTHPEVRQMVISMISGTPRAERGPILDRAARDVGLPDCAQSLIRD